MKKVIGYCAKVALSGLLALFVLSVFCFFYDNIPSGVEQPLGITNYRYSPDTYWSNMTEGFGFGRIDNIGYNNAQDLLDDAASLVVFLGSSHTEAFQLPQKEQFVSLTQEKLLNDENPQNDYHCLNLGASSHYLKVTVSHFETIAECFDNMQYAVIETNEVQYSADELQRMLNGEYHDPLKREGAMAKLLEIVPIQRNPFLRSLKKQYDRVERMAEKAEEETISTVDYAAYREALEPVLAKISSIADAADFRIIILYHHSMKLEDQDGLVKTDDPETVQIFTEACQRYGIQFINISDTFIANYQSSYEVPYGFMNTAMGSGHLNAAGHRMIADAVYQQICELEKVK